MLYTKPYIEDKRWKAGARPEQAGWWVEQGRPKTPVFAPGPQVSVLAGHRLGSEGLLACRGRPAPRSTLVLGGAGAAQS